MWLCYLLHSLPHGWGTSGVAGVSPGLSVSNPLFKNIVFTCFIRTFFQFVWTPCMIVGSTKAVESHPLLEHNLCLSRYPYHGICNSLQSPSCISYNMNFFLGRHYLHEIFQLLHWSSKTDICCPDKKKRITYDHPHSSHLQLHSKTSLIQ